MTTPAAQEAPAKLRRPAPIGRTVFIAFMGLAIVAWIAIAIASNTRAPGVVGFLGAMFGGIFVFVLIAAVGGWVALKLSEPAAAAKIAIAIPEGADPALAPHLAELETYRADVMRQVKERSAWRVPLAMAVGLAMWTAFVLGGHEGGVADYIFVMTMFGIAGYLWVSHELTLKYATLYREKVLPKLAATFGDLSWRRASKPDLARLKAEKVFRGDFTTTVENEIAGMYRGLNLSLVEVRLRSDPKVEDKWAFDGLLVRIVLARDTGATTAVIADGATLGNLRDRLLANGRQRAALEDSEFERLYETYSDNPAAARALLHPALVAALKRLRQHPRFGPPMLFCLGAELTLAIPRAARREFFAPPGFGSATASTETLVRLREDIAAVLPVADALIDLNHRSAPLT